LKPAPDSRTLWIVRHLKKLALLWSCDFTAADALDADAQSLNPAVNYHLKALQVGTEGAASDSGWLLSDAA
jgi:hypothetical protein